MDRQTRWILFGLFFISGFSGLVYQVIWTRLAFASFGIILPVLSVVVSVFMLGLSVGSWAAGRMIHSLQQTTRLSAAWFYGITEFIIGLGAFAVPGLFGLGQHLLLGAGESDSVRYLFLSALVLAVSTLPWCLFMGATFPLMMAYVRERTSGSQQSFSLLYLANVLGAMCGTLLTALVLIELLGFRGTLAVAATGNSIVAIVSAWLGYRQGRLGRSAGPDSISDEGRKAAVATPLPASIRWILFMTGFSSLAMEVVWARAFTPTLRTQIYSFASIVFCYLAATAVGSALYRLDRKRGKARSLAELLSYLSVAALLPVLIDDLRILPKEWIGPTDPWSAMILLSSIVPLCALLGYLTPSLIDRYAEGDPRQAGKAYALNVLGCIIGPLIASYVMLPRMSERHALILLSLPFLIFWFLQRRSFSKSRRWAWGVAATGALTCSLFVTEDFEQRVLRLGKNTVVRRDYAASVISVGEGRGRLLLVNGMGVTVLSPVTKYMVHLPLALQRDNPASVLIICFGMGTTHRSSLSWDVKTTSVELIPGVRDAFGFYHEDADEAVHNSKGRIIVDDGRRYLMRSSEQYDAIVLDPPPPVMAAGSSLLYSVEFYDLAKKHLKPNGVLETWVPYMNLRMAPPIVRSICDSFPHVRCFRSIESGGYHVLGSMQPINVPDTEEIVRRMPPAARKDALEWSLSQNLNTDINKVLTNEVPLSSILRSNASFRITDDRPLNEYYLVRQILGSRRLP